MVQWRGRRQSRNVEDARGRSAVGRRLSGGKGSGMRVGGVGTIVLLLVVYFMGGDVGQVLSVLSGQGGGSMTASQPGSSVSTGVSTGELQDEAGAFVSVILADTETTWERIFEQTGSRYPHPKLRLFSDAVDSACGFNTSAVGPFYCPADRRVYLDLSFFAQLQALGAPGDFAQAYVIGHEVAHHVQNVTGVLRNVQSRKSQLSQREANRLQVLVELQADCYAGVWAHYADRERNMLEAGDLEEGLKAASAIGDDALQRRAGRAVRPESFTHGSSAERMTWFRRGFDSGQPQQCDTFADAGLNIASLSLNAPQVSRSSSNSSIGRTNRTTSEVTSGNGEILAAFAAGRSDVQVKGAGVVRAVLPDDNEGSRHQRFILDIGRGQTILVAHNIDLAPRVPVAVGDEVLIRGRYEWNERGGVVHWTHHDPQNRLPGGWIEHRKKKFK